MSKKFNFTFTQDEHQILYNALDYVSLNILDWDDFDMSGKEKSCYTSALSKVSSNDLSLKFTLGEITEIFRSINYVLDEINSKKMDLETQNEDFPNLHAINKLKVKLREGLS